MRELNAIDTHLSVRRSLENSVRRRIWRWLFEGPQRLLGGFFSDSADHIGIERLIAGDVYEAEQLQILGKIIDLCGLGTGMAADVGANIGNHSCWLTKKFGHVVCIEPGKVAALILRANLISSKSTNWDIFEGALAERSGEGILNCVNSANLGSSQVLLADDGKGDFPILTGDELLRECNVSEMPLEFMKVDVEGFELAVLKGCDESISKWAPIISVEALEEDHWLEIRDLLEGKGYQRFLVLKPDYDGSLLARARLMFHGRSWRIVDMPKNFPDGGYPMVFCFTQRHLKMIGV